VETEGATTVEVPTVTVDDAAMAAEEEARTEDTDDKMELTEAGRAEEEEDMAIMEEEEDMAIMDEEEDMTIMEEEEDMAIIEDELAMAEDEL